jgi:archaellum component FlaC
MSRKLEKYLAERRKDLDVDLPDDDIIWNGIKKRLHGSREGSRRTATRLRMIRLRNVAAAFILVFFMGYLTNDLLRKKYGEKQVTLSSISGELGEKELQYKAVVSYKTDEVRSFNNSQDSVIRQLFREIKKLDTIYTQSMKDLKVLGPDERVINTIFATYEQKISLLELIILETNKTESHEKVESNRNNEKNII